MIQITFKKGGHTQTVASSTEEGIHFKLDTDGFKNQAFRFVEDALLFDGYSIWYEDRGEWF